MTKELLFLDYLKKKGWGITKQDLSTTININCPHCHKNHSISLGQLIEMVEYGIYTIELHKQTKL